MVTSRPKRKSAIICIVVGRAPRARGNPALDFRRGQTVGLNVHRGRPHAQHCLAVLSCVLMAAACGSPSQPTPSIDPPRITCPGSQSAQVTTAPAIVTYPAPTVTGGSAPVTIVCIPPSGSSFLAGSTNVSCTAIDAQQRTNICTLTVAVTVLPPVPRLSATRFVAFGDSITEGKLGPAGYTQDPLFPDSYALVLYNLLIGRYTTQTIDMYDRGLGGERVVPNGVARLPDVLNRDAPQVLLLLEGVNDLINGGSIASVVDGLRTMIREARNRPTGIVIFLGTLLPERPGGLRVGHPELIAPANVEIRQLAKDEGAILVDLYEAFGGLPDPLLIDADGLHPTAAGYKKMGETFFSAISSRLESTAALSRSDGSARFDRAAGTARPPHR